MSGEDQKGFRDEHESSNKRRAQRTRVREVDFMRVEQSAGGEALHSFEEEVKKKMSLEGSNPREDLIKEEERKVKAEVSHDLYVELLRLSRKSELSQKQKQYFELRYIKKLTFSQIAAIMKVSRPRAARLGMMVLIKLKKNRSNDVIAQLASSGRCYSGMTPLQQRIARLKYIKKLSVRRIAVNLNMSSRAVYQALERIRKINFPDGTPSQIG